MKKEMEDAEQEESQSLLAIAKMEEKMRELHKTAI